MSIWDFWASKYERLWVQKYSLGPTRKAVLKEIRDIIKNSNEKVSVEDYKTKEKLTDMVKSYKEEMDTVEVKKEFKLIDVGCGTGQLTREIKEKFHREISHIEGVDYSKAMVEEATKKSPSITYSNYAIEEFQTTKKFNIITCTHSFPYYKDKRGAIEKFYNLLEEGGYVLLAQASERSFYDKLAMFVVKFTTTKASYLSPREIKELTKDYFTLEKEILIREKSYMPSIMLFKLRRK